MLPNDRDAHRLAEQTFGLGDFLAHHTHWRAPQLHRKVMLHGHCHRKAVLGMDGERAVLRALRADVQELDDGCCGMAGAFGFEAGEHYDVSIACGELATLPHVRSADRKTIVIGDGFSCREQIAQQTTRQGLHLADVVWLALRYGPDGPPGDCPELAAMPEVRAQRRRARTDAALPLALASLLIGIMGARVVRAVAQRMH